MFFEPRLVYQEDSKLSSCVFLPREPGKARSLPSLNVIQIWLRSDPRCRPPKCCNVEIDGLSLIPLLIREEDFVPNTSHLTPGSVLSIYPLWKKKHKKFGMRNPVYCPNLLYDAWVALKYIRECRREEGFWDWSRAVPGLHCPECGRKLWMTCLMNKHSEGKCISKAEQRENSIIFQKFNMRVNARAISSVISVLEDVIIKGTLGKRLKYTGLVSKAAHIYKSLKIFQKDERHDSLARMKNFISAGAGLSLKSQDSL